MENTAHSPPETSPTRHTGPNQRADVPEGRDVTESHGVPVTGQLVYHLRDVPCGDALALAQTEDGRWIINGDYELHRESRFLVVEKEEGVDFVDRATGEAQHLENLDEALVAACTLCHDPEAPCRQPGGVKHRLNRHTPENSAAAEAEPEMDEAPHPCGGCHQD